MTRPIKMEMEAAMEIRVRTCRTIKTEMEAAMGMRVKSREMNAQNHLPSGEVVGILSKEMRRGAIKSQSLLGSGRTVALKSSIN
jgi:hypothetical protein